MKKSSCYPFFLIGLLFLIVSCKTPEYHYPTDDTTTAEAQITEQAVAELTFSGESAFVYLSAQMAFGPRHPGASGSEMTRDYIEETMSGFDWQVERQAFTYNDHMIVNIIARAPTSHEDFVVFGAHYDTRIHASEDEEYPLEPVPGANDGASGVAVLLELARTLNLENFQSTPVFVFFDAEDNGGIDQWQWIIGSSFYVARLQAEPAYAIIVDMVGDSDQQIYFEANSDEELRSRIWTIARSLGYEDYFISEVKHSMLDDHTPFLQRGIPAVDIIDFDYPFWHTTQDTLENVSTLSLERVGRTLEVFLEEGY